MRLLAIPLLVVLAACGGSESVGVEAAQSSVGCPLLFSDDTSALGACLYGSAERRLLWVSDGEIVAVVAETPAQVSLYAFAGRATGPTELSIERWIDDPGKYWAWEGTGIAGLGLDGATFTLVVDQTRSRSAFARHADADDPEVRENIAAAWRFLETARIFIVR